MPVPVRLKALKPEIAADQGDSLGAQLRRRRRELGLRRVDAAARMGVDEKTLMWWERDERAPMDQAYPSIICFLGCEPWPEPQTLGEALVAERRRHGLAVKRAATLLGVDEGTWLRWESGEWKPTSGSRTVIDAFLRISTKIRFPEEVR